MGEFWRWTRGDDFGKVEEVRDKTDEYWYFISGNRCSTELVEDYMIITTEYDPGLPSQLPIAANNFQQQLGQYNVQNNNVVTEKNIENYNKILKLSDNQKYALEIITPDDKTIAIMQMSGINVSDILFDIYSKKLKSKISEILNEDINITE